MPRDQTLKFRSVVFCVLFLAGCGSTNWQTSYTDVIDPGVSANWRIGAIDTVVPRTLTVSEENSYAPDANIVWREDPPGNRYEQVDAIFTDAAKIGTRDMRGSRAVTLRIEVAEFHALSQLTRSTLQNSGVHKITFNIQVFDTNSGAPLSAPDQIRADLVGFTGDQAIRAMSQGLTQKIRIVDHVSNVIAGWLGQGPDVRGTFTRNGR